MSILDSNTLSQQLSKTLLHHTISNHEFLSCAKNDFNNGNDNLLLNDDGCSAAAVPLVLCSI